MIYVMKTNKGYMYHLIYILSGIIILLLLLLHLYTDRLQSIPVSGTYDSNGISTLREGLMLSEGCYQISLSTAVEGTVENGTVDFYSPENGIILRSIISNSQAENSYQLSLNKNDSIYIRIYNVSEATVRVNAITVVSEGILYNDTLLLIAIFMGIYVVYGFYYFKKGRLNKNVFIQFILIYSAILVSSPMFCNYIIDGHDIRFQLYRIEGIKEGILSGQFPVRIHPIHNNGYGYATPVMYPELFLYFPAFLRLAGISTVCSYHIFIVTINFLCVYIMFYAVREISESSYWAAILAFCYSVASYRIICLYQRAAIGEGLALAFLPLVIAGLYNLFIGDHKKWYQIVIGATGILQSHMISTLLTFIVAVMLTFIYFPKLVKDGRWKSIVKAISVILLINAWYIIPFIDFFSLDLALHHTTENLSEFYDNAVFLGQLFNLFPDKLGISKGLSNGMSWEMPLTLGGMVVMLMLISIILGIKSKYNLRWGKILLLMGGIFALLSTSVIPWRILEESSIVNKFAAIIQFPWRFLGMASVLILTGAASIIPPCIKDIGKRRKSFLLIVILVCGTIMQLFLSTVITNQPIYLLKMQTLPQGDLITTIGMNTEYMIEGTNYEKLEGQLYTVSDPNINIVSYKKAGTNVWIDYTNAGDGGYIEVPLLWYPGYKAVQDGNILPVECGNNNVVRIYLENKSAGTLQIKYTGKFSYHLGEMLALVTGVVCVIYVLGCRTKRKRDGTRSDSAKVEV